MSLRAVRQLRPSALASSAPRLPAPAPAFQPQNSFASKSLKKFKNFDLFESKQDEGDTTLSKRAGSGVHPNQKAAARVSQEEDEEGDADQSKLANEKQHPVLLKRMLEMLTPQKPFEDRRPVDIDQDRLFIQWYQGKMRDHQTRLQGHLDNRLREQRMALNALPPRWRRLALLPDKSIWPNEIPLIDELPPWWMAKGRNPKESGRRQETQEEDHEDFFQQNQI